MAHGQLNSLLEALCEAHGTAVASRLSAVSVDHDRMLRESRQQVEEQRMAAVEAQANAEEKVQEAWAWADDADNARLRAERERELAAKSLREAVAPRRARSLSGSSRPA